jgi:CubicO group peptidase (beta-lactamase class C family)
VRHQIPATPFLAAVLFFGCAQGSQSGEIDLAPLQSLDQRLAAGEFGLVDAMLVLHKGQIVFERTYRRDYRSLKRAPTPGNALPPQYYDTDRFPFYQGSPLHTLQSVTKSVTSAVVGVALLRKDLPNLDVPVMDFLGERVTDPRKKAIKLEHVLTMTVGNDWDESSHPYFDAANPASAMEKSDDWLKFVIDRPMLHDPGTVFSYSSGSSLLLSAVLQKATGMAVEQYAARYLFEPLGIKECHWARVPRGYSDTEGGLYLAPHDLAKIGLLYLRDGVWEGHRILPEGWVAASLSPRVAKTGRRVSGRAQAGSWAYGYQWWLRPVQSNGRTSYVPIGRGFGGQILILLPEDELIGVFNAWNITPGSPAVPVELYLDSLRRAAARLHGN